MMKSSWFKPITLHVAKVVNKDNTTKSRRQVAIFNSVLLGLDCKFAVAVIVDQADVQDQRAVDCSPEHVDCQSSADESVHVTGKR